MALSNAERQRLYRQRRHAGEAKVVYRKPKDQRSRGGRLREAVRTIITVREEYRQWRDSVPETLEASVTVELLDEVIEALDGIDLEGLAELRLPRGYGRDG